MSKIQKLEPIGDFFVGKGDIIICAPLDLATATLADLTGLTSLGDIKQESCQWTGDAPTFNEFKNENGEVVVSVGVKGTFGVEFTVMSFSEKVQERLLKGAAVATTFAADSAFATNSKVAGFGSEVPVIECPIIVLNTEKNKAIIFPNAKIISQPIEDGGLTSIKCTVTAQKVDTAGLKTVMFVSGDAQYA